MSKAPIPDNEAERLQALYKYQILDTGAEEVFDDFTRLASQICGTSIALISLVDAERQWFKSRLGLNATETHRDQAFCAYAILKPDELLIVEDATLDDRFADNPLVKNEPKIRFYAGAPLLTPDNLAIGTLCVVNREPMTLSPWQQEALRALSRQVIAQLELRFNLNSLRQSEERFKGLLDSLKVGIVFRDPEFQVVVHNQAALDLLGVSQEQMLGKSSFDPEWHALRDDGSPFPRNEHPVPQAIATRQPVHNVVMGVYRPLNGDRVWLLVNADPQLDENGNVAHVVVSFTDISDRKAIEATMQQQAKRLQLFADTTLRIRKSLRLEEILETTVAEVQKLLRADRVAIYQFDADFGGEAVVESVNPDFGSMLGVEILDPCFAESFKSKADDLSVRYVKWIDDVETATLHPCYAELMARFEVKAKLVVSILIEDKPWGLLIAHQCSSYRKWHKFEIDALKQIADQVGVALTQAKLLHDESQQRQELTTINTELEKARRKAEDASLVKSQFLATMSHEIRTPMHGVLGMTELLTSTQLDSEQRDFVKTIKMCGDNLLTLIDEILDFSKLEAGEVELENLDFDLVTCVEEVCELFAVQAQSKGLEITTLIYTDVPTKLRGDVGRLRRVLVNLIGNAIKFTDVGEIAIEVALRSHNSDTVMLLFSVIDTGIGIPPEASSKLFQPFSQVDASTTRKYGGTGLGLAICKQLITMMSGEIGFNSSEGGGSTFWFTALFPKQYTLPDTLLDAIPDLSKLKILMVDDNATNRKILRYQADAWGIYADEVSNGAEALQLLTEAALSQAPYNLAIIDMQMPEMDGLMLGQQIKSNPSIANIPLIMMTSINQRGIEKQILAAGFTAFLIKPVKRSRLLETITTVALASDLPQMPLTQQSLEIGLESAGTNLEGLSILLAEDNPVNQKVAIKQLQKIGCTADVVTNGQEALNALSAKAYDVILMDCQMPVMDGYTATREIRDRESKQFYQSNRPITIIAMTANAMAEDRERCIASGMDDYLSKPVARENLMAVLNKWYSHIFK
jgi:PAS domain S-box-containing protein